MKLTLTKGITSYIAQIFISDASATDGSGLTGLVFDSSGLTAHYHRPDDVTATVLALADTTLGSGFVSGAFEEIDATNMPGCYEFHIPDACLAVGAESVLIQLKGATNMANLPLEIQLDATNLTNIEAELSSIKGAGFDTGTDSLKKISNVL